MMCQNIRSDERCQFINIYSEIEGLQSKYQTTYTVTMTSNGALISIHSYKNSLTASLVCLCPYLDFCKAECVARFLHENSVSVNYCQDILHDNNIIYTIVEQKVC